MREKFSAAIRSAKRPSGALAAMVAVMGCCNRLDKALTFGLSGRRHRAVVDRAEANPLGGLLAHMIRVATYQPPEMHAGLLAS